MNVKEQAIHFDNWKKSRRSYDSIACVEVGHTESAVGMRDSKNPDGGVLVFSRADFGQFIKDVQKGKFTRPNGSNSR